MSDGARARPSRLVTRLPLSAELRRERRRALTSGCGGAKLSVEGIMLAECLQGRRDRVADELERRAAMTQSTEAPTGGRRRRLGAFVDEVIGALKHGNGGAAPAATEPFNDEAAQARERELVLRYLIEQIEQRRLEASPGETVAIARWAAEANGRRLDEQNRRLCALLDQMRDSAALFGQDGRILYCNRRAIQGLRDAMGVPRGQIIGRTPVELGVPGEIVIGRPISELESLARAHESFEMLAWGHAMEGQLDAIYRADGTVTAIALTVRDVHQRKLTQTRLDLLSKLSALSGMLECDEAAEALVQVPLPELADWCAITFIEDGKRIGRTFLANRDPSKARVRDAIMRDLPTWERHPLWQGMLTTGFQLLTEVNDDLLRRLASSEQQYRLLAQIGVQSLMVVPLVSRGKIAGIMTFAYTSDSNRRYGRDDPPLAEEIALHAAHRFENARLMKQLRSSEARFRIALAGARTAVYEQDRALRYVWYYNPLVPTDLLGKTDEQQVPAEEAAVLMKAKRRVLEEGEPLHTEMDFTLGQGPGHGGDGVERRHVRETIEPLRDHSGRVVGVIGATTDITEQQRTNQQLAEELDFHERMMGVLGHDLRNPLNAVMLTADLLLRGRELTPAGEVHVRRLRRAAGRMEELIETLLDFTRARFMGKLPVSREPADLGEITRTAVNELRVAWPGRRITVDVHGDPRGEWDRARLLQTISNLVTNAICYGDDGVVAVTIEGEEREVVLKVHNDGPPISRALRPVLFEPFRRGVPADRSPRGLGLGLYIVRQIVLAHDGSIDLASGEQVGTTFTVHLPRHPAADAASPAA
jgi:signal transduction histidine kinase/GAF domain-containing protein